MKIKLGILSCLIASVIAVLPAESGQASDASSKIKQAVAVGKICYKLTEPEEIKTLLGMPQDEKQWPSGGMLILELKYPDLTAFFGKFNGEETPFTLLAIEAEGKEIDIGRNKKLVLRSEADLGKIDKFFGLQNVSLARLDLKERGDFLRAASFDSLTEWPPTDRLPAGFDPNGLLLNHRTPGLGVGELHKRGIDGTGIGVAIIDQPLLLGHREYASRIARYDATGLGDMEPQMHGSPVTSILVGQTIGVAPRASLTYFAVPMWERDNLIYVEALNKIFAWNRILPATEKIRAVSISTGDFSRNAHFEEWTSVLAEAERQGILVVCCDRVMLKFGILACAPRQNPDEITNYSASYYSLADDVIRVPGAGRTLASFRGDDVYFFDRDGGASWGAPYIAGLAALAFQVAPEITPKKIIDLLVETAVRTDAGPVVNPRGFIEAVEKEKTR